MTKKNIRPQQVAPVERETISASKDQSGQITPLAYKHSTTINLFAGLSDPFAGDDAE
ncbi:anacyclamide/piricyclamide family prenylated cyclic peptide [Umezakia ovalisporum]|uniref:anacyclamide/piricyclamide family prenylated cyclic peptide n=1 Tax=Umezakia ovalisporum TaxID=75695 RepID=UPI0036F27A43